MKNLFRNIKFSGSDITSSDLKDLNKVIKSGWLAHGEKTEVFELKFSEYTNSKYSIALSSCTSGLYILAKFADFKKTFCFYRLISPKIIFFFVFNEK